MGGEKIHWVLNVYNSLDVENADFDRLSNNPSAEKQCKSPKKGSWCSDQGVHTPPVDNISAALFSVSVDKYYKKQHNDDQKLAFVGEVGNLQISIILLLRETKSFQGK